MKTIVTIGREYGSGGRIVAQRLAEKLGVPFYDKEVIQGVAKKTGFAENFVREAERRPTNSFMYDLYFSTHSLSIPDQVFIAQSGVIKDLADKGGCVIVGRCADYILREHKELLRTFVYAPLEQRVQRAREEYHDKEDNLEGFVIRQDKQRASYYNYFTSIRWGDRKSYDLCVSSALGLDTAVEIIYHAALAREAQLG
ncbi:MULTISPECIES: AAA family ATPase [Oscillospiraceae]|uniref:Cytidylate kinase-like family protein n=1 Tax=Lawsonibacter faecis TaxID=2763052 RepID=A0A8J6ME38_9FIRM|nr:MULTISPECIES: cytidylate kinase-like family protein [Oscillospiraceae]MTQ96734.1 cytidylate kinase-like family protein [Pseudoflavonifractor sp. BIOML-A16]MTR04829.1 cytidylate kinase-like family protein [Pseudoflavonifractor sp. BIOML-A15]MTR30923.1 cytidylate kinase-like family protein [Pseudoflavonifractor sp. BIOML-A14]MTR71843.1 cytidylate kinase-like family protein [Pseudoflavonifractor sp. BIOML-A18]MTS63368.1 cytidylate kinase-like family protein [Pseudoflavonifractor sp. BIOML-A5]